MSSTHNNILYIIILVHTVLLYGMVEKTQCNYEITYALTFTGLQCKSFFILKLPTYKQKRSQISFRRSFAVHLSLVK